MFAISLKTVYVLGLLLASGLLVISGRGVRVTRGTPKRDVPLTRWGRHQLFLGVLIGLMGLGVSAPSGRFAFWFLGLVVGALGGFFAGGQAVRSWGASLEREGNIPSPVRRGEGAFWAPVVFVLLLVTVLVAISWPRILVRLFSGPAHRFVQALLLAASGFWCALGTRAYLWAKQREREGRGRVVLEYRLKQQP
jgi:hypothetical protein